MAAAAFADEGRYRRLKVTGAGPGLSELVTFVRVGATEQVLRLAESSTGVSHRRNFTVDWAHLKLNDSASRTVLYRDPLDANLEMAQRLIASISGPPA